MNTILHADAGQNNLPGCENEPHEFHTPSFANTPEHAAKLQLKLQLLGLLITGVINGCVLRV